MFRCGDPRDPELAGSEEHSWVGSTHSPAGVFSPGAMHSARWVLVCAASILAVASKCNQVSAASVRVAVSRCGCEGLGARVDLRLLAGPRWIKNLWC
jgi:hypothetical protein